MLERLAQIKYGWARLKHFVVQVLQLRFCKKIVANDSSVKRSRCSAAVGQIRRSTERISSLVIFLLTIIVIDLYSDLTQAVCFGCRCIIFFYCWLCAWLSISQWYNSERNLHATAAVVRLRWHEHQWFHDVHVCFFRKIRVSSHLVSRSSIICIIMYSLFVDRIFL